MLDEVESESVVDKSDVGFDEGFAPLEEGSMSCGKGTADANGKFPAKINKDKINEMIVFLSFFIKSFDSPILINF